jgi:hypothetical protein
MFRPKMANIRCLKFGSYNETVVITIIVVIIIIIGNIDIILLSADSKIIL